MLPDIKNTPERKHQTWMGMYRSIPFEINQGASCLELSGFTYYIYLNKKQWPAIDTPFEINLKAWPFNEDLHADYYGHPIYNCIDFHGGITFGQNETRDAQIFVKLGCDYAHYGDQADTSYEDVLFDVQKTINSFRELVPDYKCKCMGDGRLVLESEGEYTAAHGYFYSTAYTESKKK